MEQWGSFGADPSTASLSSSFDQRSGEFLMILLEQPTRLHAQPRAIMCLDQEVGQTSGPDTKSRATENRASIEADSSSAARENKDAETKAAIEAAEA